MFHSGLDGTSPFKFLTCAYCHLDCVLAAPTENWGDVWVDALYRGPEGEPLKARSYLVVTIPTYIRYDQPEVSE